MATFNTRLQLKYDTLANWLAAKPVLLAGEIGVCSVPTGDGDTVHQVVKPAILFKVGDGKTTFDQLPWASGLAADVYEWAKKENLEYEALPGDLKGEITSLKTLTGGELKMNETTYSSLKEYIDAKTAGIATDAALEDLTNKVIAIEKDYLKTADKEALEQAIKDAVAAIPEYDDDEIKDLITTEETRATEAEKALSGRINTLEGIDHSVYAAKTDVEANTTAITTLNGNSSTEGSVDKKIKDAFNDFAIKVSDDSVVNTYKELIDYAASHGAEFTTLVGEVDKNTRAITTLNGDSTTVGSVDKKIVDAIAGANLNQYETTESAAAKLQDAKDYADSLANNYATADQGGKADTAIQEVTTTKNGGLKVTKADNSINIDIDEDVTFVFYCGTASKLTDNSAIE